MKFLLLIAFSISQFILFKTAFAATELCSGDEIGYLLLTLSNENYEDASAAKLVERQKQIAQMLCSKGCWSICGMDGSTDSKPEGILDLQKKCLGDDETSCQEILKKSGSNPANKNKLCLLVGGKYCGLMGETYNPSAVIYAHIGCKTGDAALCTKVEAFKAEVAKSNAKKKEADLTALQEQYVLCQNSIGEQAITACSSITYIADKLDDQKKAKAKSDLRNFCGKDFPMTGQCYAGIDHFELKIIESTLSKWCFMSPAKSDPKIQSKSCWRSFEIAKLGRDRNAMGKIRKRACELDSKADKKLFAKCMKS